MSTGRVVDRRIGRDLGRALRVVSSVAADFDSDLDRRGAIRLARDLYRARAFARAFHCGRTLAGARALDRVLCQALDRARALDGARLHDEIVLQKVHPGAIPVRSRREVVYDGSFVINDITRARTNTSHLVRTVDPREQGRARERGKAREQRKTRRVAPSAAGLVTAAVRLLPAGDRARYAEEYLSELWDLAQSGAGRLRQLGYAFRQLRSNLSVGFALRSPRRRGAAP